MKTKRKKQVSLLVCLILVVSLVTPVPAYAQGEQEDFPTLVLSPSYLIKSDQEQTVTMEIRLPVDTACESYNYTIVSDDELSIENATTIQVGNQYERGGYVTTNDHYEDYVSMGEVTFTVPANTAGVFTLGLSEIIMYNRNNAQYIENGEVNTTLTIYETAADAPAQGNAVSLQGSAAAVVGDKVLYTIRVTGESYASAQMQLTYDPVLLSFEQSQSFGGASASNGTVTLVDYGQSKTPPQQYTVAFTATANGTAATALTAAAFGTSGSAVSGDLTPAAIETTSVNTVISKASFAVTLPVGATGATVAAYGADYTFSIETPEPDKYTYNVTATMGENTVDVIANPDGTYTVETVTGDLVITVTSVPKQYTIHFISNTIATGDLPKAGNVVYGTDYHFIIPIQTGCTVAVTSATIGGKTYTCPSPVNGEVTIPGEAIIGNIVIDLERVTATVTVEGTGAGDAKYEPTATVNSEYIFTLNKAEGYDYTVTATMDGKTAELTAKDDTYTISNVTGPIVITIGKAVNTTNTIVGEYLKLNGTSVWLVKKETDKLNGQVYSFNGTRMVWSEAYDAYCCLAISSTQPVVDAGTLKLESDNAATLASTCDVNQSGKVDANDAQLTYDLYNGKYTDFTLVSMEKFLLADTNGNGAVDTTDASAIVNKIVNP